MLTFNIDFCQDEGEKEVPIEFHLTIDEMSNPKCKCLQHKDYSDQTNPKTGNIKKIIYKFELDDVAEAWLNHAMLYSKSDFCQNGIIETQCCCIAMWLDKITDVRFTDDADLNFILANDTEVIVFYFYNKETKQAFFNNHLKKLKRVKALDTEPL